MAVSFIGWVTDKLYHIILYQVHLTMIGIRTYNVSGDRQLPYNNDHDGPLMILTEGHKTNNFLYNIYSYIVVVSFIGGRNRRKPPTCRKSLTKFSHNVASSAPRLSWIPTHNFSGDRHCKSNYHTIMNMMTPM